MRNKTKIDRPFNKNSNKETKGLIDQIYLEEFIEKIHSLREKGNYELNNLPKIQISKEQLHYGFKTLNKKFFDPISKQLINLWKLLHENLIKDEFLKNDNKTNAKAISIKHKNKVSKSKKRKIIPKIPIIDKNKNNIAHNKADINNSVKAKSDESKKVYYMDTNLLPFKSPIILDKVVPNYKAIKKINTKLENFSQKKLRGSQVEIPRLFPLL